MKQYLLIGLLAMFLFGCAKREVVKTKADVTVPNIKLDLLFCYGNYATQEITVSQYNFFLDDLKAQGRLEEYEKYRPAWEHWDGKYPMQYNEPMPIDYSLINGEIDLPITNISLEGAQAFCTWLTTYIHAQPKINLSKSKAILPTEYDWILMAHPFMDNVYPWIDEHPYDDSGNMFCNVARVYNAFNHGDTAKSRRWWAKLEPIVSNRPNGWGLYNIIGNAAEMTCEGYIKGGSWTNSYEECALNRRQQFELPHPEVGFRVLVIKDSTYMPLDPFSRNRRTEYCLPENAGDY